MKKLLSLILTLAMVLSLVPTVALAAEANVELQISTDAVSGSIDEVRVGDTIVATISNKDMNVSVFTCGMQFDNTKLECISIVGADPDYPEDIFVKKEGKRGAIDDQYFDQVSTVEEANERGTIGFVIPATVDAHYFESTFATVTFKVIAKGNCEISAYENSDGADAFQSDSIDAVTVKILEELENPIAITGVTVPAKGVALDTDVVAPDGVDAAISWYDGSNAATGDAKANTAYTAKISVAPEQGYAFAANTSFTVDGEKWTATPNGDSYILTKTFDKTADKKLVSIAVSGEFKTTYAEGDSFDPAGMVVTATYDDDSTEPVSDFAVSPETMAKGTEKVTVTYNGKTATVAVTVLPKPTASDFDVTYPAKLGYDSTAKQATVKAAAHVVGMGAITVKYFQNGEEYGANPVVVGTYDVVIDVAAGEKYAAIKDLTVGQFTIEKADNEWLTNPTISGWTYGQTASEPSATTRFTADITYKYLNADGIEIPKPSDAGTYSMVASTEGTENYRPLVSDPVKFTIAKAKAPAGITGSIIVSTKGVTERAYAVSELNLKLPEGFEFKNPQIAEAYAVTGGDYGSVVDQACADGAGKMILSTRPVNPESKDLVVVGISSDNHDNVQIEVNVTAKAVDVEPALAGVELVDSAEYGTTIEKLIKKLPSGTVNAKDGEGKDLPGTLSMVNPTDIPDVGTATVYVRFTVSDTNSPYYAVVDTPYSVTITQKPLAVTWTDTKLTYNGEAQNPKVTVAPLADDEVTVSVTSAGKINAGSYKATAAISGADATNYTLTDATKAFEIAPKALTITLDKTELPYNGKEQAPTVTASGVVSGDDVNVTVDKKTVVGTHNVTAVCDNANYTISNASQSYKITALDVALGLTKTSSSATMSEVDAWTLSNLPTTLSINGTTFDGAPTTVAITDWKAEGYSGNDVLGYLKGLDASASDKVVKLTPVYTAESWMNVTGADTYTLTITSKYPVDVTLDTKPDNITYGETLTYAGGTERSATQTEIANGTDSTATFKYFYEGIEGTVYESSETVPTAAGKYRMTAVLDSKTHTGSDYADFTIAKKELTATWSADPLTYNAAKQAPAVESLTGIVGTDDVQAVVTEASKGIDADDYTAIAELKGEAAANYTLANAEQDYTIAPAALTLDTIANVVLVGSNDSYTIAPKANGLFGSDKATFAYEVTGDAVSKSNNVIKAAANGQATITVTATNDNYVTATTTFKASAVVNPFAAIEVEGGAVTATVEGNKIVATGTTTNIAGLIYNFTMATVEGAEIGAAVQNGKTVTVPVSGKTMTYTIDTKGVTEVDVEIEYDKHNQIGSDGTISGMSDNLSSAAVQDIAKAAKDKNLDKVTVDVTTEVKTDSDGNISIDASYSVQGHEDIKGEITSTSKPVSVEVPTEADEGEQVFVKTTTAKGAASYKTVTVGAGKVVPFETKDFTNTYKVIVPETITVKFSYESDEPGNATETYTVDDLGEALPVDEKSGHTFMGWDINGKTYKTVSEILWDIDLSKALTAVFEAESDSDPTYIIKMNVTGDGSIKVNTRTPEADEEIVITVNPDKDCYLEELTVINADGDELDLDKKGSKYYFDMPACTVTIKAVFSEGEKETGFSDVAENAYYFDAVEWAVEEEITTGYANGTFLPNATCTRAQTVTFLWRAMGEPKVKNAEMPFTDVAPDAYYYDAVLWAVENGITSGVSETSFAPNKTVTRAQTVTFLWRTAKMEGYDVSIGEETNILSYNDAETIGSYAIPAMQWACGEGIMGGYSDGTLRPNAGCTRAQIVTFLYRFLAD